MNSVLRQRSLLLVHAHPDDESIFTGGTMAKYAAEGARVTLVTCTMGEMGGNRLARAVPGGGVRAHRRAELAEARRNEMAEIRRRELDAACAALGVADHRFLGAPGRWRDSGPGGGGDPRAFSRADVAEAAHALAAVIREVSPQVVVTYDANGFYGHIDHIQAHRVAWRAYQMACDPRLTKFYAIAIARSVLEAAISHPGGPGTRPGPAPAHTGLGVSDEEVTTAIDATGFLNAKLAALRSHATQIVVNEPFVHVVGLLQMRALSTEYYTLLAGPGATVSRSRDRVPEDDLFSRCTIGQ